MESVFRDGQRTHSETSLLLLLSMLMCTQKRTDVVPFMLITSVCKCKLLYLEM